MLGMLIGRDASLKDSAESTQHEQGIRQESLTSVHVGSQGSAQQGQLVLALKVGEDVREEFRGLRVRGCIPWVCSCEPVHGVRGGC